MTDRNNSRAVFSSIYAGIGFGLLLGLIMGLSVSPTVKVVLGALTSILGALLGLENKIGKSGNDQSAIERNLKLGSFGFAVVIGILCGIYVRTHNAFSPSITEKVQTWLDAGYDSASARKYVAYELLKIDPLTGAATDTSSFMQMKGQSALFNATAIKEVSTLMDTVLFRGDINKAKSKLKTLENKALDALLLKIESSVPQQSQMLFIDYLRQMSYEMGKEKIDYCKLSSDPIEWKDPLALKLSEIMIDVDYQSRPELTKATIAFFCSLK